MDGYYINEDILHAVLLENYQRQGLFDTFDEDTCVTSARRHSRDLISILDQYHYGDE